MKLRTLLCAAVASFCLFLVSGCTTTKGETATEGGAASEGTGAAATEDIQREGGSVRRKPFHPTMPSEINRADYRYW